MKNADAPSMRIGMKLFGILLKSVYGFNARILAMRNARIRQDNAKSQAFLGEIVPLIKGLSLISEDVLSIL